MPPIADNLSRLTPVWDAPKLGRIDGVAAGETRVGNPDRMVEAGETHLGEPDLVESISRESSRPTDQPTKAYSVAAWHSKQGRLTEHSVSLEETRSEHTNTVGTREVEMSGEAEYSPLSTARGIDNRPSGSLNP